MLSTHGSHYSIWTVLLYLHCLLVLAFASAVYFGEVRGLGPFCKHKNTHYVRRCGSMLTLTQKYTKLDIIFIQVF